MQDESFKSIERKPLAMPAPVCLPILRTLKIRSGRADLGIADFLRSRLLYLDVRPSIEVVDHTLHDCLSRPTPILCCLLGQPML